MEMSDMETETEYRDYRRMKWILDEPGIHPSIVSGLRLHLRLHVGVRARGQTRKRDGEDRKWKQEVESKVKISSHELHTIPLFFLSSWGRAGDTKKKKSESFSC